MSSSRVVLIVRAMLGFVCSYSLSVFLFSYVFLATKYKQGIEVFVRFLSSIWCFLLSQVCVVNVKNVALEREHDFWCERGGEDEKEERAFREGKGEINENGK